MQREVDLRKKAVPSTLSVGDSVIYQSPRYKVHRKTESLRDSVIYKVIAINGSMVTVKSAERELTRNSSLFRRYYEPLVSVGDGNKQILGLGEEVKLRRSERLIKPVVRFGV